MDVVGRKMLGERNYNIGSREGLNKGNQADFERNKSETGTEVALRLGIRNSEVTTIDHAAFKAKKRSKLERLSSFWEKFLDHVVLFGQQISGLFVSPLVKNHIYFALPESSMAKVAGTGCVYETATAEFIDGVFEERKEKIKGTQVDVNLERFPGWDEGTIDQLREEFRYFDKENKGYITFDNMSDVLDMIGNKSTEDERKSHFDMIDTDRSGKIDFHEFCTMVYNLSNAQEEFFPDILYDLYKPLDRDMLAIPGLTVLQQLQSGLF